MLNYEPDISKLADPMSQKVNEVEFEVPADGTIRVPLNVLHTATWWIDYMKVPLDDTDMRIDNVTRVELLTGAASTEGEHVIELRSLRLHGKWITSDELYMGLMAAWILCAVSWPVLAALQLRRELSDSGRRLALLGEINAALQLEARELVEQANTDPLTGTLNRQGLRAALMSTASLLAPPVAVVFADIDHFKGINDRHGHDVGDAVLRDFAAAIHAEIRTNDRLVRWGGEEFLIVCPATGAEQARQLAEKLRAALHAGTWPAGLRVTASFGIAARAPDEDIGAVIKRADGALYAAKAAGRDRVMVAEAAGLPQEAWTPQPAGRQYD
jgi:diguanylate cyclase (GGDEF)-like protein